MIHDTNFIEKRYEEAPIRKLDKSIYSKNKLNFLKPKQHKQIAKEKDNFFTDFQNNFLGNYQFINLLLNIFGITKETKTNYLNIFYLFNNQKKRKKKQFEEFQASNEHQS